MSRERMHMDCWSGDQECLLNEADCPMKPCPECGSHLKQQKMYAVLCGNCQLVLENQTPVRFPARAIQPGEAGYRFSDKSEITPGWPGPPWPCCAGTNSCEHTRVRHE